MDLMLHVNESPQSTRAVALLRGYGLTFEEIPQDVSRLTIDVNGEDKRVTLPYLLDGTDHIGTITDIERWLETIEPRQVDDLATLESLGLSPITA